MALQRLTFFRTIAPGAILCLATSLIFEQPAVAQPPIKSSQPYSLGATKTYTSVSPDANARANQYAQLEDELSLLERQFSILRRVVKLVAPTVVHIDAIKEPVPGANLTSGHSGAKRIEEAGAGVVLELETGLFVVTNRHVVHSAKLESIRIEFADRSVVHPQRVWSDAATDIAILAIPKTNGAIPARIGNSENVEIGDFVLAVGSPFGLAHSCSYGIISAKGRRNLELGNKSIEIQDFLQTDAAINPGNSGGPLMNMRGEVIGINTAIASNSGGSEGIGFSIPINMVINVASQLIQQGQLRRGYLGVQMENSFDIQTAQRLGLSQPRGALVKAVKNGSPAARAGIRVGDVVLEFDRVRIENDGHLVQTVGLTPIGTEVDALVLRDGRELTARLILTELPATE